MINKVKIGHRTFKVVEVECVDKHESLAGQINYYDSVIKIDSGLDKDHKKETLLHEIIHGVEDFMNLDLEENEVQQLGRGLMMVIKDNPRLLEVLK